MDSLNIVVAQNPAELDGPQARFDWLEKQLQDSQAWGADLLVLPELFLTGYNIGTNVNQWCEAKDGPYARKISVLCKAHKIAIHYGYAEHSSGKTYNSANCFGSKGERLGGHQKLLLPPGFESDYFATGNHCEVFTLNGFKIATLICYDCEFPENFRHAVRLGAELVLVPTALDENWGIVAHKLIPVRAFENGVYVCYVNQSGVEHGMKYLGHSCIVGPNGHDIARAGPKPEILQASLTKHSLQVARDRLPYLQDAKTLPW